MDKFFLQYTAGLHGCGLSFSIPNCHLCVCLQIQISSVQNKQIGYQLSSMWEDSLVGTVLSYFWWCNYWSYMVCTTVWLVIFARDIFSHFLWVKSHSRKLKIIVHVQSKWTLFQSLPTWNYLYSHHQRHVSKCAFDGYHWSYSGNQNAT